MKTFALFALLAAALAGCNASPTVSMSELQAMQLPNMQVQVLAPPARYLAAGTAMEQAGRVDFVFVSEAEARRVCNGAGSCTFIRFFGSCRVTISTAYTGDFLVQMMNHERAHCGGWPRNHPP